MEQFRAFLEVLKKYHFWILCGLIVFLSFGTWFLGTSSEEKNFRTRTTAIQGKLSVVRGITNNSEHPSHAYNQEIFDITSGSLARQVASASNRLYLDQQKDNPLPAVYPDAETQKKFKDEFMKIWGPMETIAGLPPGKLDELYRQRYRDHIKEQFPILFQLIERRDESAGNKGIVDWRDADSKMQSFLKRYTGGATPTTLDIMMAQEDYWVYETLLKVVRNTNNFAEETNAKIVERDQRPYVKPENHKKARIKEIQAMDIGKDAVESWAKSENALFTLPGEASGSSPPAATPAAQPRPRRQVMPRRPPLRVRAFRPWRAATSMTRASPCRTPPNSPTGNSA